MTDPRQPDDVRMSTADLANATERGFDQERSAVADRDVTHEQRRVVADAAATEQDRAHPLFADTESDDFRGRWGEIQTGFVDEPRQAVERADALVAAAIKRLAEIFANERATLEQQWSRGDDVSTEDLRIALRKYRGFFDRLLSV